MKPQSLPLILTAVFLISLYGCKKENNNIIIPTPATNGSLLIYTKEPTDFTTCGPTLLVTLNTGQQSTIVNYYSSAPSNCANQFGGVFSLPAGTYTYTVTTLGGCTTYDGTVTVAAGVCNYRKIH